MRTPGLAIDLSTLQPRGGAELGSEYAWPAVLPTIRAMGYQAVELQAEDPWPIDAHRGDLSGLRRTLERADVAVSALSAHGHLQQALELAQTLGGRTLHWSLGGTVRVETDASPPAADETERALVDRLAREWKAVLKHASARRVHVLWDVASPYPRITPSVIEQVLRAVDDPSFGLVFDTGEAEQVARRTAHEVLDEGKPLAGALGLLERFKGSIGAVRLSEPRASDSAAAVPPGQGTLDWARLLPALVDAWIPARWWTVDTSREGLSFAQTAAAFFHSRILPLYPETFASAPGGATPDVLTRTSP